VHESLGVGGMATVHRAEQRQRDGSLRQVALKRLLPTLKKELVTLFLDEARLLHYLDHPNIASTFDSGRVFGTYFIAMEYVRGPTLKELVQHCALTVGAVPKPVTLNLAAQLCDALDHAHNRCDDAGNHLGIIHRDVTPANILLSDQGLVKVIDFGLAKATLSTERTSAGVIKGKFGYIAPEYLVGKLDLRVDLWAVGIIMYELLTSRRLFDGVDNLDTMMRVRQMPIPRPSIANPAVTPDLDELVMRALEREPERRWQSASAMRDGVRAVIAQSNEYADNRQVADWARWVFEQKRGRPPQFTPVMAMPVIATPVPSLPPAPSAVARAVNPSTIVSLPGVPALAQRSHSPLIIAGVAFVTLMLVMIILRLVT
nr:serine/threonine protein kinase [Deltaproteobacteria bacterium]